MSPFQIFTLIIAAGGLIVSILSFKRSRKLQRQQLRLQTKQEELTDYQLKLHKEEYERTSRTEEPTKQADIRLSLEGTARKAKFVIRNWGFGPAKNVNFNIQPVEGHDTPLVSGDYDKKFPIPNLSPGSEVSTLAALTQDTGITFDVTWFWEDENGTKRKEKSRISL